MGDKDNGDAAFCHSPDRFKQGFGFLLGKNRSRFIQDEDLQLLFGELTCDLGELLVSDGHVADHHFAVDIHAHHFDGGGSTLVHLCAFQYIHTISEYFGDHVFPGWFSVQQYVFCGSKAGDQGKFLMHHANAGFNGIKRRREVDGFAVQDDLTAISAGLADHVRSEKDPHESGLAGTVFAHQSDDFSFTQRQVDVCQDLVAEEILLDVFHFEKRSKLLVHVSVWPFKKEGGRTMPSPFVSMV